MEILISLEKFREKINEEGLSQLDFKDIKNELDFEEEISLSEENIGPGADVMVILVSILTIAQVFLLGEKIDKGIDGWLKLGKRVKNLFHKKKLIAVDQDGASLLAIEFISNLEPIKSLQKQEEHTINLVNLIDLLPDGRTPENLITKPFNYFIQSYIINDEKLYVLGIKSSGEVNIIKCFDYGWPYSIVELEIPKNNKS
jgi:hypothetical protein